MDNDWRFYDYTERQFMNKSPGWGDGDQAEIARDIFRVQTDTNMSHPHLPGDFIRRKKDGDFVLMTWDKFDNIQQALKHLGEFWEGCNPRQEDLEDYQIFEMYNRLKNLCKMVGVKK